MIDKRTAFGLAHGFARQISSEEGLRAKLRHAAAIQSPLNQRAVDCFVGEHIEEFIDQHLIWLEANKSNRELIIAPPSASSCGREKIG